MIPLIYCVVFQRAVIDDPNGPDETTAVWEERKQEEEGADIAVNTVLGEEPFPPSL